jgi:thiamine pyrophosphate-dependent acetolactate synthase large subunit-like protein
MTEECPSSGCPDCGGCTLQDSHSVCCNQQWLYAAVKAALHRYGGPAAKLGHFPETDISGPHYAHISRGFGVFGQRVERLGDFEAAFRSALKHDGPAVIEVMTD